MKIITLLLTIVLMSIGLLGCQKSEQEENGQKYTNPESLSKHADSGNQSKVDAINSTYRSEDVSISIFVEQERYNQGETPVITIRNDGETSVDYTGVGTILEYLQDNVWIAADSYAVTEDKLNVLELGQKMEQKISPSILQEGVYRVVFIFKPNSNEEKNSKRVAVSFYVD